jgi:alpha-1,2-glucosyltransferase
VSRSTPDKPRHVRGLSWLGLANAGRTLYRAAQASHRELFLGVLLGVLYVTAIVALRDRNSLTDEVNHFAQIHLLLRGDWRVVGQLTTIPGYHAATAAILWLSGADSLAAARLVSAAFGLLAIAGFHALRRQVWPTTETLATAQFVALPIVVPFFFVVYTDIFALALLLWATFATLKGRHWLSALLLVALVCVRQNEVVWAGFLAMLAVWPAWRRSGSRAWREIAACGLPYLLPVAGFLAFWAWNGSISLSNTEAALHPDLSLHAGNLYFALVLAGALLPFHVLAGLREFADRARTRPWLFAIPLLVFAGFWWGFHADNPYNTVFPHYYLHNEFVWATGEYPGLRAALAALAAAAACGLALTLLRPVGSAWIYIFAALFLAASWLVESRYVLVPFVLWLALREQRGRAIENATLALWLVLAVLIFSGTVGHWAFP